VLAALEVPAWREQVAELYRRKHPDRVKVLDEFLAALGRSRAE
jgi:DnaJ-domain-containing protein 1